MATNGVKQIVVGGSVFVAVTGFGYLLMKLTSPSKEDMMKRLPAEQVQPAALAETDRRNAEMFRVLQENMKSSDPVWKVKGRDELSQGGKFLP